MNLELTKSGLLKVKDMLSLARQGYRLMDQKRNILISELVKYLELARELQEKVIKEFERAYSTLTFASITLGMETVEEIAFGAEEKVKIAVAERSVMGVPIPILAVEGDNLKEGTFSPFYSVYRTNMALDRAILEFRKLFDTVVLLAEIENAIYRLAWEIKVTQRRANALEEVIIPELEKAKKRIEEHLEEREREEFFKLKRIKRIQ
ncbi:MAG: V-type ATP synthase subunit D [Synergistetes bacterium]|nr:V-type ATP synthase subunit D [Synergistota bacterium]